MTRRRGEIVVRSIPPGGVAPTGRDLSVTRAGAWLVGGLIGALVYSAVCWTLIYHGAQAAIAWMTPEPRIEAAAAPSPGIYPAPESPPAP